MSLFGKKKMVNIILFYEKTVDILTFTNDLHLFGEIINRRNSWNHTEDNRMSNIGIDNGYIKVELDLTEQVYKVYFTREFIHKRACIASSTMEYEI